MKEYGVQFVRVVESHRRRKHYPIGNLIIVNASSKEDAQREAATVLLTGSGCWEGQLHEWLSEMTEGQNSFSTVLRPYKLIVFEGES